MLAGARQEERKENAAGREKICSDRFGSVWVVPAQKKHLKIHQPGWLDARSGEALPGS